jgi:cysteine desulfurase
MFKKERVYLDWAAAAPVSARARRAFMAALPHSGNPGATHAEARAAKAILEEARTSIARLAEVKTDGVVFTSGATEANALAILGSVRAREARGAHVLFHPAQHASVVTTVRMLEAEGADIEEVDLENLKAQLRPETVLLTLDAVCGETGTKYDTLAARRSLDAYRKETGTHVLLHVDASQAPRTEAFTLAHLGADMATLDAQKVGGVRGIGALLMRQGIPLAPLSGGGGQERGRRSGTENPALALAFAAALSEVSEHRDAFAARATHMRTALLEQLSSLPYMVVNEGKMKVPHILNVSLIGRDTDYLALLLDTEGFAVSTKSACESEEESSRAVFVLTEDAERARSTLRISWGPEITEHNLTRFAEALARTIRFLDEKAI